jgi:NAD(P)-dependent dehydrogenase (short-subunit alcohol dehydrogenase family)
MNINLMEATMTQLINKIALVTGGSRGLGRGIVEALAAGGAQVWALARDARRLDILNQEVKGVQTWVADVADPDTAPRTLRDIRPDILVLNAGAAPHMAPLHQQSWEQFSRVWETDVKATFYFGQEALLTPLAPGSVVVIVSSGAAIGGSALSGGYAGAKRMQWLLAQYLQQESDSLKLGIRFVALLPRRIFGATELGHAAASAYAAQQGISKQAFLEQLGPPLTLENVGQAVVALLTDNTYQDGIAFGLTSQGLAVLN